MTLRPFHLAFPVHDRAAARDFYGRVLGCREGRSSDARIDLDFLRGWPGEQATMFFRDPSGNALEFKAFADDEMLFETETRA